jgi:hypothetical protein
LGVVALAARSDVSVHGRWSFTATLDTPSTTLNGRMNIVLDSAGIIIGAVKLDRHVIPFKGRHIDRRIVARSDSGFVPVLRLDCTLDTLDAALNGVLQISRIRALDHHNKATDYTDLIYQFYGLRD